MSQTLKTVSERKLHLGCDEDYREGWHNVDVNPRVRADTHHDLDEPWPFGPNEFSQIQANHVLNTSMTSNTRSPRPLEFSGPTVH